MTKKKKKKKFFKKKKKKKKKKRFYAIMLQIHFKCMKSLIVKFQSKKEKT